MFTGELKLLIDAAIKGDPECVDFIMDHLDDNSNFAATRFVDYALSFVVTNPGIERIQYFLFNGSQIQRNYASLYFNRAGNWLIVKEAFQKGLIDEIQAYAR